ncbi:hypothetical protein V500_08096 [Pseudogymnoascus sp. VKM F-4518 (FW-2643)]|nr:hypothetical protein V500_08096 [Pseudogymnoascus sp. VKM F-4518 (FW-2643)]
MHSILPIVAFSVVCAKTASGDDRDTSDRNQAYLNRMCYPLIQNLDYLSSESLVAATENSPFPCEQEWFLSLTCMSNGTTPNDFLAEQQCLCGGNYFETNIACYNCQIAHGLVVTLSNRANVSSAFSSLSKAECSASPVTQPYSNLFPPFNFTSAWERRPSITLSSDKFPKDTRVENYWTGATAPIAGKITGSAVNHLSSMTNIDYVRFTPTAAAATGGNATTSSPPTSTGDADAATSTGGAAEVRVAGRLLAAVIGVLAVL